MGTGISTAAINNKEGSTSASTTKNSNLQRTQNEIVHLMMPLYYNKKLLTPHERELAVKSWNLIVTDTAPGFLAKKGKKNFLYHSSVTFFYDTFYSRLFDIHPMCKQLFKSGMRSQGTFLVKMISLALSELEDPAKFDNTLKRLAEVHYERGVKAMEYGVVGEVLFFVLNTLLGSEVYTRDLHIAWVKIYNRMIRTIIPVAVALGVNCGASDVQQEHEYEDCTFSGHQAAAQAGNNKTTNTKGTCAMAVGNGEEQLKSDKLRAAATICKGTYPDLHSSSKSSHC